MQKPIVTGIMAYGMSGKVFHAPFISTHPGFEFKAVIERTEKRVYKDFKSVTSYESIKDFLANDELELIIVNTPNNTHFDFAKQALLAGKHVLIEKPAATSVKEAEELFKIGREVDKKVLIYHNRRWSSDFISAKNIIQEGKLGEIIEAHFRFDRYKNTIGPKHFKETLVPGSGMFYDLASHLIDQAISLFGKPISYHKVVDAYRSGSKVDDYGTVHLQFPNKINVFITISLLVADPQAGLVIHGTKGSYIKQFCDTQEEQLIAGILPTDNNFGKEPKNMEGKLTLVNERGEKSVAMVPSSKGTFMDLFEAVFQSIRNDIEFPVTEEDILTQLGILEK